MQQKILFQKLKQLFLNGLNLLNLLPYGNQKKQRPYPYRKINVGNYTVWYVVIDHIMEVRRILYSRRDEENLI